MIPTRTGCCRESRAEKTYGTTDGHRLTLIKKNQRWLMFLFLLVL